MGEKSKQQKKGSISEEDVSTILQRYKPTTVLALLQEVSQVQDVKIDWDDLVKKTTTGITNPREYQMLWRHLAYGHGLLENFEDEAKPMDDDSDLEYEMEPFPTVSSEASAEAAACVKVLMASGSQSVEKGSTIEAPLTINIPKVNPAGNPPENPQIGSSSGGTNIIVPVFVQKQPLPTVTFSEGFDTNGSSGNLPPRRKRKPWSAAEDKELFAAVQKCGEGNWANILKGDFKGDRTASQLSQRWNIIKKRNSHASMQTASQLSEVHLAARRALNMALDQPRVDNLRAASSIGRTNSIITPNISARPNAAEAPSAGMLPQNQDSASTGAKTSSARTQPLSKWPSPKPLTIKPDAVKAAGPSVATQPAGTHSGPDYFRDPFASIPPSASRAHLGLGRSVSNVGSVVQAKQSSAKETNVSSETNNGLVVKASVGGVTSGPANSLKDRVKENQSAVEPKTQDQENQAPAFSDASNGKICEDESMKQNREES